jgi:hypothetical protein
MLVLISTAASEEIVIDTFDSGGDWYLEKDRGGTVEISSFNLNGTGALHFYNFLNYGDRYEKVFSISAENLENYIVSAWFYNNNSYTNVDIYLIDDGGVECSNSINSGFDTGEWNYFSLRIGDFEKCDYQSLVDIDKVQLYIGENPAEIYIDELRLETSDEPLPPDGYVPPTYDPGWITIGSFNVSQDVVRRGEPVYFTGDVSSETGISSVTLNIDGNNFMMQRLSGSIYSGSYTYTYYPPSDAIDEYDATMTANDLGGNVTVSSQLELTVDPIMEVVIYANSSVPDGSMLNIWGTVSDGYSPISFAASFSGDGWSYEEMFSDPLAFLHGVNTSLGQPGQWNIGIVATDIYNNYGVANTTTYVSSFENSVLEVVFIDPVETQFHNGEEVPISVTVNRDGSPIEGAYVVADFDGSDVVLQGQGTYSGTYQIPWERSPGQMTIYVEALDGADGGVNSTSIEVLESQFEVDPDEQVFIVGLLGRISINLTFNDSDPVTNATLVGTVGGENITFVEVEPGVYTAEYTPKGNETEMVITGAGGFSFTHLFTTRYPTVVDYIVHNMWFVIGGGIIMASGIIFIRRRMRH